MPDMTHKPIDKEKILERSRKEQKDEGELYLANKGRILFLKVFALLVMVFLLLSFFKRQSYTTHVIMSIFWSVYSIDHYYRYRFNHKKIHLISFIGSLLAGIIFGILAVLNLLLI